MPGEGFIAHMIASLKANKRVRVSIFDKIKNIKKNKKTELFFPNKATKKDLKKLREKIERENTVSFFKKVGLILIALAILFYIINLDNY